MKIAQLLLNYLHTHPTTYHPVARGLENVVAFRLPDTVIFPYQAQFFPDNRLEATRLDDDFIPNHPELVRWLAAQIDPDDPPVPSELWLTLGHITSMNQNFIEISFE